MSFLNRIIVNPEFRRALETAIDLGARRFQVIYCEGTCCLSVLKGAAAREIASYWTRAEHARVAEILDALNESGAIAVSGTVYRVTVSTLMSDGQETIITVAVRKQRRDCRRPCRLAG